MTDTRRKTLVVLDAVVYWAAVLIPFSMAISSAAMEVFSGLLLAAFLTKRAVEKRGVLIEARLSLPCAALIAASAVSFFNSVDHQDSFAGLFKLARYILLFMIMARAVKDRPHLARIALSMGAGALLVSLDAFWQVRTGSDFIRGNAPIVNIGLTRATASFPDSNVLGVYLSAVFFVPFVFARYLLKNARRIFASVAILVMLAGIALTYSRPTLLAVYVCAWGLGVVKKDRVLMLMLAALLIAGLFLAPQGVKDFARHVEYNPVRFMCNDDRIAIFRNSFRMFAEHPVIGVGVNTFMKNYSRYKESPEYRGVVTSEHVYAHNNFLHMAGETGILGLGAFLWFLAALFGEGARACRKIKRRDDYSGVLSLALGLCLVSFLINGFAESSLYYSKVAPVFWYLAGLLMSVRGFAHEDTAGVG